MLLLNNNSIKEIPKNTFEILLKSKEYLELNGKESSEIDKCIEALHNKISEIENNQ